MTEEQIRKALKCCTETESCNGCPYYVDYGFKCKGIDEQLINLINRHQAEIDRLKTEKDNLIKTYAECQIDFLKEFTEKLGKRFARNGELSFDAYYSVMGDMEELFASMTGKDM